MDFARLDAINRYTTVARLLSSVVHETGNALQVIGGHAELLQGAMPTPEKLASRATAIASHTAKASSRLREVSGLLNDSGEAGPTVFDLQALAVEAMGLRSFAFGRGRIAATLAPEGGRFPVRAVRAHALRILLNLLMNAEAALKPQGSGTLGLTLASEGALVRLTVADNGPGISVDRRESLFDPFNSPVGPGLGLHVSRGLAERHGGTLSLSETPDGASFVLSLPGA
ncbi:MAG TPA: HAMP domain-containing sensor histidine kinase [Vicinamibacterales bacterium]|nr:HAMP domain-containing sensor histidine kinase [Vicinamibacterales bacterium]